MDSAAVCAGAVGRRGGGPMRRVHGGRSGAPLAAPDACRPGPAAAALLSYSDVAPSVFPGLPFRCVPFGFGPRSGGPRQQKKPETKPSCRGRCGNSARGAHMALNALVSSSSVRSPTPLSSQALTATGHGPRSPPTAAAAGARACLLSLGQRH